LSVPARAASAALHAHRPVPSPSFSPAPPPTTGFQEELVEVEDESRQSFKIFAVRQASELRRASALLQRRYAWRGYSVAPLEARTRRCITLTASQDGRTVATITAALDSAEGLFVEALYPDCVGELRQPGRKLCEFTKFAVDESVRSQALLGAIFHVACMYVLEVHRCTDALIEVNPRHVRFYERMLGFEVLESARLNRRVNAPAVLLGLDLNYVHERIAEMGRRAPDSEVEGTERSLYPYCFSAHEEAGIAGRLRVNAAS